MSDILIGKGDLPVRLLGKYGNRHGLVAGATGTGKSVTLMVMAEGFSRLGVPVFMADVKGDIAGLAVAGTPSEKLAARVQQIGVEGYTQEASPVVFWDLYGKLGHPVRTTVSEVGPALMSRMLELNDVQAGVMDIAFKLADDQGLLLLDLEDLRALLNFTSENKAEIGKQYGLVSPQSVAAIQRALLRLEQDGGEQFFGEPALQLEDLMRQDMSGRGVINLLAADQLILKPRLYSSFLLWLLSELFETLPEVGDLDVPKLVFFFDEAHLLFDDCPPSLQQRVEQVVRLIRSKGVGVYFCSARPPPARPDGGAPRRRDLRAEPQAGRGQGDRRAGRGRGAGVHAAGQGHPDAGGARADIAAALPDGRHHGRGARHRARPQPGGRQVRHLGQSRIRLRDAGQARRTGRGAGARSRPARASARSRQGRRARAVQAR